MRPLSDLEKGKFKKAGIITSTSLEYWIDRNENIIISENALLNHFNVCESRLALILSKEAYNRTQGKKTFSFSNIKGAKKF